MPFRTKQLPASNLYAGRAISLGTLIAIFLSTSDEMLPIMISEAVPVNRMMKILLVKLIIGIITGFVIDGICHLISSRKTGQPDDGEDFLIERLCEKEHCQNEYHSRGETGGNRMTARRSEGIPGELRKQNDCKGDQTRSRIRLLKK